MCFINKVDWIGLDYITVTVHYIHNWTIVNRILATREVVGSKTSDLIRTTVVEILEVADMSVVLYFYCTMY